jgi:hypothetical protein
MSTTKFLLPILVAGGLASADAGILPAPRLVEASDGAYDNAVLVTWTTVEGADAYRIFRSDDDDWMNAIQIGVTSDTAFIDPVRTSSDDTPCQYWVAADAGGAVSVFSEPDIGHPGSRPARRGPPMRGQNAFRRLRGQMLR